MSLDTRRRQAYVFCSKMKSNLENSSQNGNSGQNDFAAATARLRREFVMRRFVMQFRRWLFCNLACAAVSLLVSTIAVAQTSPLGRQLRQCDKNSGILCTERLESPPWGYIGHDEPSLLFYSNQPGSGYANIYRLTLPKDRPSRQSRMGAEERGTSNCARLSG